MKRSLSSESIFPLDSINESVKRDGFSVIHNFFPNFFVGHILRSRVARERAIGPIFNPDKSF